MMKSVIKLFLTFNLIFGYYCGKELVYYCEDDLQDLCRFSNVTIAQNQQNVSLQSRNPHGASGVCFENSSIYVFNPVFCEDLPCYHLNMSGCDVRIIKTVPENNFDIGFLDLSHNKLKFLDDFIFASYETLEEVDLSFNQIEKVGINAFTGNTTLLYIYLSNNRIRDLKAGTFSSLHLLKKLDLSHNFIKSINEGEFSAIQELILRNNRLTSLTGDILKATRSIVELDLSHNNIEIIPKKAFSKHTNMIALNLEHNNVKIIKSEAFKKDFPENFGDENDLGSWNNIATDLEMVIQLNNNNLAIINENIFGENDSNSPHITMFLDNNPLKTIEKGSFSESLLQLSLSNVTLERIDDGPVDYLIIENTKTLKILNLTNVRSATVICSSNSIETLVIGPHTASVNASRNNIKNVYHKDPISILTLNISCNKITNFSNIIELKSLIDLDVSFNPISWSKTASVSKLKDLKNVNLRSTNLPKLENNFFSQQANLEVIDISDNNLSTIDFHVFAPCSFTLTKLLIEGNKLKEIVYANLKDFFPNLLSIELSNNDWSPEYVKKMTKNLLQQQISVFSNSNEIQSTTPKILGDERKNDKNIEDIINLLKETKNLTSLFNMTLKRLEEFKEESEGPFIINIFILVTLVSILTLLLYDKFKALSCLQRRVQERREDSDVFLVDHL